MIKNNSVVIGILLFISSHTPVEAASLGSTSEYCSNPASNLRRFSLFESQWPVFEAAFNHLESVIHTNYRAIDSVREFTTGGLEVFNSDAYKYANSHTYDSNAYGWDGDRNKQLRYNFINGMIIREDAFQQVRLTNMNWFFDNNKLNQKEIKSATFSVFDKTLKKLVKYHVYVAPKCYSFEIYFNCNLSSEQLTSSRSFEYFVMSGDVDLKREKCSGWHCKCHHSTGNDWGWVAKFS